MAIDPVCGMEVKEEEAAAVSEYEGKKYYFCSTGCKHKFDDNPESFIKTEPQPGMQMEKDDSIESKESERVDLPIVGMTCASCATGIQSGLSELSGMGQR